MCIANKWTKLLDVTREADRTPTSMRDPTCAGQAYAASCRTNFLLQSRFVSSVGLGNNHSLRIDRQAILIDAASHDFLLQFWHVDNCSRSNHQFGCRYAT